LAKIGEVNQEVDFRDSATYIETTATTDEELRLLRERRRALSYTS